MPAALTVQHQIDWAGIRANAVSMGIRAAARAAAVNLPDIERERFVFRVLKRAQREKWEEQKYVAMSSASSALTASEKPMSSPVLNASDSVATALAEDSNATKTGFSRMARRVAEAAASYKAPRALKNSRALRDVATIAGQVHGWDAKTGDDRRVMINIGILTQ
jgi:hypothetical protein